MELTHEFGGVNSDGKQAEVVEVPAKRRKFYSQSAHF